MTDIEAMRLALAALEMGRQLAMKYLQVLRALSPTSSTRYVESVMVEQNQAITALKAQIEAAEIKALAE